MGWKVDSPGTLLRGGSVATDPRAREEALFPGVPQASGRWASACTAFAAEQEARLQLVVTTEGTIVSASPLGADVLSRCIADQAKVSQLSGVKLPSETKVTLRLAIRKAS